MKHATMSRRPSPDSHNSLSHDPGTLHIFAIEIRYYARQAGLPDELWQPMLETQPSASRAEVRARIDALTLNITKFLVESR